MFYHLAQVFAPQYMRESAGTDLGIPLRLQPDVNEAISRSTVQQTYDQIKNDLQKAVPLLPNTPLYKTRPSRPAAFALMSKTHLVMQDYEEALRYADSCLKYHDYLLNYSQLDSTITRPFPLFNEEVIFHSIMVRQTYILGPSYAIIDHLYQSYQLNDLRRQLFFREPNNYKVWRGSYTGGTQHFSGLATDEIMLTKAECHARLGETEAAISTLNQLLETRWETNLYESIVVSNAEEALDIILEERRKQLLMRGTRWTDLRRLNLDSRFAKTLTRTVHGETYSLPPNDKRYTLPIPQEVISLNPNIEQNER